jgi:hypothetical protein
MPQRLACSLAEIAAATKVFGPDLTWTRVNVVD